MQLLPPVKKSTVSDGVCNMDAMVNLSYAGVNALMLNELKAKFPACKTVKKKTGFFLQFAAKNAKDLPAVEVGDGIEAYQIRITEDTLRIDAKSEAGLFYGIQTFLQMPARIPCGEIRDEASIPLRMIHWDLKGYEPKFDLLLEEMRILASYKVNSILLEIEDKYDYKAAPGVGCPGAYTYEQMRKLSKYAKDLHIQIIPKLQCLAHSDYILKHKKYKALRENGHVYQFCVSNPKAQQLWENMAAELMDCFAEHKGYFHIGADEAINLGECPKCAKLGKTGSFLKKVGASVDYVLKNGWQPIIWDDILRNLHGAMTDEEARQCWVLGKKAILMYWAYGYGGVGNEFPLLKSFLDEKIKIFGASGYAGCDNWAGSVPPLDIRGKNIDAWTKTAIENKLECVCATGWTRIGSADCPAEPQESSWFTILYAANSMWSGKPYDYRKFICELSMKLFGEMPEQNLIDAILNIKKSPYPIGNVKTLTDTNQRLKFLRLAAAAECLDMEREFICNLNKYYFGKLGNKLEDYRIDYMNKWPGVKAEAIAEFKKKMTEAINEYYIKFTADDFINSRFGYLEKLYADAAKLTAETEKM
ncbi:MAG: family 20 glycosylhydrolase [Lentisphaeria bacterium]|nr:family 20 glycosylhydrolase [Lentisphaeria bacterium]